MEIKKRMANKNKFFKREDLFELMRRMVSAGAFLYDREGGYHGHIVPKNMVTDGVRARFYNSFA